MSNAPVTVLVNQFYISFDIFPWLRSLSVLLPFQEPTVFRLVFLHLSS